LFGGLTGWKKERNGRQQTTVILLCRFTETWG
jgi:hypothetical protein